MTTAADPANYPAARKRGTTETLDTGPLSVTAPRMRVVPFILRGSAGTRNSLSLPQFMGPALVKSIEYYPTFGQDPPGSTVELGTSASAVVEADVALTLPKPYQVLLELQDPTNYLPGAGGDGFPMWTSPTASMPRVVPLDLVVKDAAFYLVVSCPNNTGLATLIVGTVRVLEGVDPEALRFFL